MQLQGASTGDNLRLVPGPRRSRGVDQLLDQPPGFAQDDGTGRPKDEPPSPGEVPHWELGADRAAGQGPPPRHRVPVEHRCTCRCIDGEP